MSLTQARSSSSPLGASVRARGWSFLPALSMAILGSLLAACMASYDIDGIRARDVSLDSASELSDSSELAELSDEDTEEVDQEDTHDPVDTDDEEVSPQRSRQGLLALYSFRNGSGRLVENELSPGTLELRSELDFEWLPEQGVRFAGITGERLCNGVQPSPFVEAIQQSGALTVELWMRSDGDVDANGYSARFVSSASGRLYNEYNFELGQFDARLDFRWLDADGFEHAIQLENVFDGGLHHVVLRFAASSLDVWVDGVRLETQSYAGFGAWSVNHPFCVGGASWGSSWRGDLFLVAMYVRGLSDEEIALHYQLGSSAD